MNDKHEAALEAAREALAFAKRAHWDKVMRGESLPGNDDWIAALLTCHAREAVEAAKPGIERAAKVEALEWALSENITLPDGLTFPDGARIASEIDRLGGANA